MTQDEVVRAWWDAADAADRRLALGLGEHDALPAELALDLAVAGVTVVPVSHDPVDGRPERYAMPIVLARLLHELRGPDPLARPRPPQEEATGSAAGTRTSRIFVR
ncbi:hypothetical protein [Kineococcus glutinatus]|uniref:Uncharacterized protein n=1 Tax=Kineococcus glutinatus TaxID=1070872 RepID=A0ABP9H6A2_9ACTN